MSSNADERDPALGATAPAGDESAARGDPALAATAAPPQTPGLDATLTEVGSGRGRATRTGMAGKRLAHYELTEEIGRGGMGVVYAARDLSLDRPVAIKLLSEEVAGSAESRARFYREARAQARLNHPNVCHIYFVGEEDNQLFFAMERIDGQSVSELLDEHGRLPAPRALEIIRQAVLGLREAQRAGIVHRDVKPSNLMIDRHGVVKVMDFGIAKQAEQLADTGEGPAGSVEQTTVAGTPLFAAPEQLRGEAIDHRADVYALGATLHQLLTGSAPFLADSAEKLTKLHQTESRPQFERRVVGQRDLALLNELTDRMMAKIPADRFATYDELLESIEFAEPATSRPAGFGIRAMAMAIDAMLLGLASGLVSLAIPAGEAVENGPIFMALAAAYGVVLLGRFGTTVGRWLLGIEVIGARPGRGLGFHTAFVRCLWELGPIGLGGAIMRLGEKLQVQPLEFAGFAILLGFLAINVIHVGVVSLRSSAGRTFWDRRAGTQVRYLRVRAAGG